MKKLITLVVVLMNICFLMANPVDIKMDEKVATNFMSIRRPVKDNVIKKTITHKSEGNIVYYTVNFEEGGWVMVSAEDNTIPVLGFSFTGNIDVNTPKPPALKMWIDNYVEQIRYSKNVKTISSDIKAQWEKLLNEHQLKNLIYNYIPGQNLLNIPDRGEVMWSQSKNNDGYCNPNYNKYCPEGSGSSCSCGKKPVGCGAVAMGQIMWYWKWPNTSSYNPYDWELMPSELENSSEEWEEHEIAKLLYDCAESADMHYNCWGSWALINNLVDGFKDAFKYKGVEKIKRNNWTYDNAWENVIRAEIDAGRPVLFYGGTEHYFVCDGYDDEDYDYFHFNFGWGYPGNSYNLSYQYLDDLTPGTHNYNSNQQAIIGISPTCSQAPYNINDVDYSVVSSLQFKHEQARHNINLPSQGNNLTVEDGGKLILTAGNGIDLKQGFTAEAGSHFTAKIEDVSYGESNIYVPVWSNYLSPNNDGVNDELCFDVYYADTWEFHAFNRWGEVVFQNAGIITGNHVCVWDGTGASYGPYECIVKFRNSCGEEKYKVYDVTVLGSKNLALQDDDTTNQNALVFKDNEINNADSIDSFKNHANASIQIYPNPNEGIFNLTIENISLPVNLKMVNTLGKIIFENKNMNVHKNKIELKEDVKPGVYFLQISNKNNKFIRKLIIY
ncbi:MAG: C10 family peptidase [Bacteroidota bacterium]|nr:C10 family peptidase [Bacteroidota bacterium]